jgi:mRNA interferase MazF
VVPLTTGSGPARYRVAARFGGKDGLILLEQIRVLDKRRLARRLGTIERDILASVLTTLQELFAE